MRLRHLEIHAGPGALARLRAEGFRRELFDVLIGASGGPKWLVLAGLDRLLFPWLRASSQPLACVGSSIGAWRHLCLAQADPAAAVARLEAGYIDQRYDTRPAPAEVSRVSAAILDSLLGEEGAARVAADTTLHTHILTVRARGPWASQSGASLLAAALATAGSNLLDRRTLSLWYRRNCWHSGPRAQALQFPRLPTDYRALGAAQVRAAALASGSIPLVAAGVEDLEPGAVHWDGGMSDYHFEPDFGTGRGLILYPHFYPRLAPGWFDKPLRWRHRPAQVWDRLVLLCPTRDFIARLPGGRIPERRDFSRLPTAERQRAWHSAAAESARLAEDFEALLCGRAPLEAALAAPAG